LRVMDQTIHRRHRRHGILKFWSHFENTKLLLTRTLRRS
jgi:hypothetical protein